MQRDCERPVKVLSKKRFSGCFEGHLSSWVSGVESPLIFYTKNKKKLNTTLHD